MKRANGSGSVYFERSRKKYAAAYVEPGGRRIVRRFNTRPEAAAWLDQQVVDMRNGDYVNRSDITIGEWVSEYLLTYKKNLRTNTKYFYYSMAKTLEPIAGLSLQKESGVNVQKFVNGLYETHKPSTVRAVVAFLRSAIEKAAALDLVKKDFTRTLELRKDNQRGQAVKVFNEEEISRLASFFRKRRRARDMYEIFSVAIYTGMRRAEILALEWNDIDLAIGTIRVSKTLVPRAGSGHVLQEAPKTVSSNRVVHIPPALVELLKELKERRAGDIVFPSVHGGYRDPGTITHSFRYAQRQLGMPVRSFHCLRHTHASLLIKAGVPITEVSHRLGHKSSAITLSIYSHFVPGSEKDVSEKVGETFDTLLSGCYNSTH